MFASWISFPFIYGLLICLFWGDLCDTGPRWNFPPEGLPVVPNELFSTSCDFGPFFPVAFRLRSHAPVLLWPLQRVSTPQAPSLRLQRLLRTNKRAYIVSALLHINSLWLTRHYSWGRFLEVLEVNANLAGFSSSPRMQSVSCADVWAADTHNAVNQTIKWSELCCF